MADTSGIRIYKAREKVSIKTIETKLTKKNGYKRFKVKFDIQKRFNIGMFFYVTGSGSPPDWYLLIEAYCDEKDLVFSHHSFIGIFIYKGNKYFVCGGGGANSVQDYIDHTFGIRLIECIFNPEVNKLDSVHDRGLIGDIIASSRYYRRGRSLAY